VVIGYANISARVSPLWIAQETRVALSITFTAPMALSRSRFINGMKLNIDRLEAGRELDALVAQNVMGWKNVHREDIGRGGKRDQYRGTKPDKLGRWRSADVQHYSTYSADAYLIPARMKELGLWERYVKELSKMTQAKGLPFDWATADQCCRAALKVVKNRR